MLNKYVDFLYFLFDIGPIYSAIGCFATFIILGIFIVILGHRLNFVLESISNKNVKTLLLILFYILFLPAMLVDNKSLSVPEIGFASHPRYVRKGRFCIITIVTIIYILLYNKLFTYIF